MRIFHMCQKMRKKNPHLLIPMSFWREGGVIIVSNEKPIKKWKLRGLKLRGLRKNLIGPPNITYENDRREKINTLGDF